MKSHTYQIQALTITCMHKLTIINDSDTLLLILLEPRQSLVTFTVTMQ